MIFNEGVSIGIPTYNAAKSGCLRLENLLINLRQRTSSAIPYEIVVCDDSGLLEHRQRVESICKKYDVHFIFNSKNSGVAAGWNHLTRFSTRKMMVLLNDDVFVANDWLSYMVYALENNPKVGSFGMNCRFISKEDAQEIVKGPDAKVIPLNVRWRGAELVRNERFPSMPDEEDGAPGKVMCPPGCFFGFRREIYDLVGGFDERYFAFYEETDFGVACASRGYPSLVLGVPDHSYHIWSASFGSAPEIDAGAVMARSRASFVEKWRKILGVTFNDAPEIHPLLMDRIEPFSVKWLGIGKKPREEIL